VSIEQNRLMP